MIKVSRKYTLRKLYNLSGANKVKALLVVFRCILLIGVVYAFYNLFGNSPLLDISNARDKAEISFCTTMINVLCAVTVTLLLLLILRIFYEFVLPYLMRFRISVLPLTKQECDRLNIKTINDYQKLISKKMILHTLLFNFEQFEVDVPQFVYDNIKHSTGYTFTYDSHVEYKILSIVTEYIDNRTRKEETVKWLKGYINKRLNDKIVIYFSYFEIYKNTGSLEIVKLVQQIIDEEYSNYELAFN